MAAGLLWAVLGVAAGALRAAQAPSNAGLGRAIGSPVAAARVPVPVGAIEAAGAALLVIS